MLLRCLRSRSAVAMRATPALKTRLATAIPLTTTKRSITTLRASATKPAASAATIALGGAASRLQSLQRVIAAAAAPSIGARRSMFIQTQNTPNPRSIKFLPGRPVLEAGGTRDFQSRSSAKDGSPLAYKLFLLEGVTGVFLGADYLTISIAEDASWLIVKPNVFATVMDFFATGEPVLAPADAAGAAAADGGSGGDSAVVSLIKELIDTRIRPSVQEDGGDIIFKSFEGGIVKLQMQGSCVGCPSSTVTLKNGIENMLMHYVPEVEGVEEWKDAALEAASDEQLSKLEAQLKQSPADAAANVTATTTTTTKA